jgi:diguanylate cyclase (GGDEF)-like protein
LRLLLVEDNAETARRVAVVCSELSRPVDLVTADTLGAARDRMASTSFDLVLVAGALTEAPGAAALAALRHDRRDVPYVALTDQYDVGLAEEFLDAGAEEWLAVEELSSRMLARVLAHAIERHSLLSRLDELAHVDDVTGALNERGFAAALSQQLALAARDVRPLALSAVDIENLTAINQEYGWGEGDRLLQTVGDVLRRTFRVSDIVGRTGDGEFAVLLTGNGYRNVAVGITRLTTNVQLYAEARGLPYTLTVSVGSVTTRPLEPWNADESLKPRARRCAGNQFASTRPSPNAQLPATQTCPGAASRQRATHPAVREHACSCHAELVSLRVLHDPPVTRRPLSISRTRVAPRVSSRATRAAISPPEWTSMCSRFFPPLPSGTSWKRIRRPRPTPLGSS